MLKPVLCAAVLTAVALPCTASAATSFGAPVVVEPATARITENPAVAVNDSGRLAVAYNHEISRTDYGVVVRRGTLAHPLGHRDVVAAKGFEPQVDVDAAGDTGVVWQSQGEHGVRAVRARILRGSRGVGTLQTLASFRANLNSPQILALGAHRWVAIWWQGVPGKATHAVRYAVASPSGRFGPARTLVPDTGPITSVRAARAPDGSIVAAWGTPLQATPLRNQQLSTASIAPGATRFGPVRGIEALHAAQGAETDAIGVASGPGGAVLTWTEAGSLPELLRAATPGGAPQTVFSLDGSTDLGKQYAQGPAFALPATGAPVAAWAIVDSTGGESEATTGGRVFAGGAQLSRPGEIATSPVAAGTASDAIVAWATGDFPSYGVRYAVRGRDGGFGAQRALGARSLRPPVIAGSRAGAVIAWNARGSGASFRNRDGHNGIDVAVLR